MLCPLGVPLGGALSRCEISHWKAKGLCAPLCDLRTCFVCWWDEDGHVRSVIGDSQGVFIQNWLLGVIGFCFDVISWSLCRAYTEPGVSDVMQEDSGGIAMTTSVHSWGVDSEPYDWLHVLSKGAGLMAPPIGGRFCTIVFFWSVGISYIWFVYTWRKSIGVLQVTGSLLLVVLVCRRAKLSDCSSDLCRRVPRFCADTSLYIGSIVLCLMISV